MQPVPIAFQGKDVILPEFVVCIFIQYVYEMFSIQRKNSIIIKCIILRALPFCNPANFISSDPSCAASTDCISGEGCSSDTVCSKYIYWLGVWTSLSYKKTEKYLMRLMVKMFIWVLLYLQLLLAQQVQIVFLEKDAFPPQFAVRIFFIAPMKYLKDK